jgi:hypothetical protein
MSYLMSTNYLEDISSGLEKSLQQSIKFELSPSEEERFVIDFHKSTGAYVVKFKIIGTEARVSCLLELDETESIFKERVLALLAFDVCNLHKVYAKKYRFTLWSREKDLNVIPDIEKLRNKECLALELSSNPCQIDSAQLALKQILNILAAFNSWLDSDVLEITPYNIEEPEEEGADYYILTTKYERSKINRDICIKHHGWNCKVCEVNLQDIYGNRAKEFIHVHHIEKLADSASKIIDPINDLIPVCPNCHCIIHRTKEPASPEEIVKLIVENKK